MPLYEYQCQSCSKRTEELQKFSDKPLTICETCGGPLKKLPSSPALHFKGSGFHINDYAKSGGKAESEAKSDGKSEAKSEGKSESKSEGASSDSGSSNSESKPTPKSDTASSGASSGASSSGSAGESKASGS